MSKQAFSLPLPDKGETGPYAVMGTARAKRGLADALEERLVSMVSPTRLEPGCLAYHVHRDRSDRSLFVFYEAWRSVSDLERHFLEPHVSTFLNERDAYLDGDLDVSWLRMASEFG